MRTSTTSSTFAVLSLTNRWICATLMVRINLISWMLVSRLRLCKAMTEKPFASSSIRLMQWVTILKPTNTSRVNSRPTAESYTSKQQMVRQTISRTAFTMAECTHFQPRAKLLKACNLVGWDHQPGHPGFCERPQSVAHSSPTNTKLVESANRLYEWSGFGFFTPSCAGGAKQTPLGFPTTDHAGSHLHLHLVSAGCHKKAQQAVKA